MGIINVYILEFCNKNMETLEILLYVYYLFLVYNLLNCVIVNNWPIIVNDPQINKLQNYVACPIFVLLLSH